LGIRTIKTAYAVGLMAGALSLSATRSAAACGGGGVTSSSGVVMNAQRVFVSARSGGTTDLIVQIAVPKTTADYGVLIPVPGEPTLDPKAVSSEDLDALDELTAPRILIADDSDSGSGCACLPVAGSDKGGSAPTRGVTASPPRPDRTGNGCLSHRHKPRCCQFLVNQQRLCVARKRDGDVSGLRGHGKVFHRLTA
jgi:hypothetical protein